MKNTFLKILYFSIIVYLTAVGYRFFLEKKEVIPTFSQSGSFDAKFWHFTQRKSSNTDLLAIGSSISYYNLHTPTILKNIDSSVNYYNLSSWHFTSKDVNDISLFIKYSVNPQVVLWIDYEGLFRKFYVEENKQIPTSLELILYYENIFKEFSFFKSLSTKRLLTRSEYLKKEIFSTSKKTGNQSLDSNGGATIIDKTSLKKIKVDPYFDEAYNCLKEVSEYFAANNIKLLYVNSPYPLVTYDKKQLEIIKKHSLRVQQIIESNGHLYLDGYNLKGLKDSMFIDSAHMNEYGAKWFSEQIIHYPPFRKVLKNIRKR